MRSNYFDKLMKYMKNVYNIERHINKLSDGRKSPKYKTAQVIAPLLLGFMLRIKSMNELKYLLMFNSRSQLPNHTTYKLTTQETTNLIISKSPNTPSYTAFYFKPEHLTIFQSATS